VLDKAILEKVPQEFRETFTDLAKRAEQFGAASVDAAMVWHADADEIAGMVPVLTFSVKTLA
jgi:hypothetical protein